MNVEMRDVLGFFLKPPMCIVRKDRNPQSVPAQSTVSIELDTVVYDNDAMFGVDASRFTCKTPGYYMFTWQFQLFAKSTPGTQARALFLQQFNTSATVVDRLILTDHRVQLSNESYSGTAVLGLNASDYVVFYCFNFDSFENQIVGYDPSQSQYGCQVSARWLSAL
ncbi:C1q-like domain-containing protein (plasmid) [Nonomuraea sp. CA-143628]|uniref:C1q-like domain-containing protein n=1 Tax=Nonomuraea sp. CA-143628 TaxID=3239997 RepID=UPI003D93931A